MSRRTVLSCDKCTIEAEDVKTHTFMIGAGIFREADFCDKCHKLFEKAIKPYFDVMHEISRVTAIAGSMNGSRSSVNETENIRTWARNHGHQVGDRGRMPEDVVKAYYAEKAQTVTAPAN